MDNRFLVECEEEQRTFKTYRSAFNYYMKIRDKVDWLFVLDQKNHKYLICENCFCKKEKRK